MIDTLSALSTLAGRCRHPLGVLLFVLGLGLALGAESHTATPLLLLQAGFALSLLAVAAWLLRSE